MEYRREIDGLRALAVVPVMLFHAGFETFGGGFVGVDIFFVISGYLITTIIITELAQENFSIANFYDRRARRILPALFFVMCVSVVFGYFLLMPDEFKNLGQSLVATSLFSNNVLLGLTSGYWELAAEFKPLLHTWSLGVEEQYYLIFPLLLLALWKICQKCVFYVLSLIFFASLLFAAWLVNISPKCAFLLLPTRAWEICIGALAAIYMKNYRNFVLGFRYSDIFSLAGFGLIIFSVLFFTKNILSPGPLLLVPTAGAVLLIIFCRPNSLVFKILASKWIVFIGLLSYSLYLWHQPMFAFLRAYSKERPTSFSFMALFPFVFMLSYLTWRFVECPFRNKSFVARKLSIFFSICGTLCFVVMGSYLNKSYGMASRVFGDGVFVSDMDKRIYDEKAFAYKRDKFSGKLRTNVLIIGNSFGRDFTNITMESFDTSQSEIIYRDDLGPCITEMLNSTLISKSLFMDADAIVYANGDYDKECYISDIAFAKSQGKKIFFVGSKNFGYNLNWIIRLDKERQKNQSNAIDESIIAFDKEMEEVIPKEHFISLLQSTVVSNRIPITDGSGRMLSTDRAHLTKYGALFFGRKAVSKTEYAELFK